MAPIIANKPASHADNWGAVSVVSTGIAVGQLPMARQSSTA